MANGWVIGLGIVFGILSALGFLVPITDAGYSVVQLDELCSSGFGQLGQLFGGADIQQRCQQVKLITYVVYGLGLIAIILIIVGAVIQSGTSTRMREEGRDMEILRERFESGEISKEEFESMRLDL